MQRITKACREGVSAKRVYTYGTQRKIVLQKINKKIMTNNLIHIPITLDQLIILDAQQKEDIKKTAKVMRAINHSIRQDILFLLSKELTVKAIYTSLRLEQSITSAHLKTLRDANLVIVRREGRKKFYFRNNHTIEEIKRLSQELAVFSK